MRVELLYFDGCPSYHVLLPRLRELLVAASVSEEVALRRIESAEEAEAEHFLGSPTLRVDGQDVDPGAIDRTDFGLKCRLYRGPSGLTGMLPAEWVRAALERAPHSTAGTESRDYNT